MDQFRQLERNAQSLQSIDSDELQGRSLAQEEDSVPKYKVKQNRKSLMRPGEAERSFLDFSQTFSKERLGGNYQSAMSKTMISGPMDKVNSLDHVKL